MTSPNERRFTHGIIFGFSIGGLMGMALGGILGSVSSDSKKPPVSAASNSSGDFCSTAFVDTWENRPTNQELAFVNDGISGCEVTGGTVLLFENLDVSCHYPDDDAGLRKRNWQLHTKQSVDAGKFVDSLLEEAGVK